MKINTEDPRVMCDLLDNLRGYLVDIAVKTGVFTNAEVGPTYSAAVVIRIDGGAGPQVRLALSDIDEVTVL